MKVPKKMRCDSYEVQLSHEEREQLYDLLLEPTLSMDAMRRQSPAWRLGKYKGKKPNWRTLLSIRTRLRREVFLTTLEANALDSAAAEKEIHRHYRGKGDIQERMLDRCITLIGGDVLQKTLDQLDPESRTAATRLLLQRSEQKIKREKLALETKKMEQVQEKTGAVTKDALDRAAEELKLL
jgi:hypothetical protein